MQTQVLPYHWLADAELHELLPLRRFGLWQVLAAKQGSSYLLLLVNAAEQTIVRCDYEAWAERLEDIELLNCLPPDGEAGAGVFAVLNPSPPSLSGAHARFYPPPS